MSSDYRHANLELRLRLAPTRQTTDLVGMLDEFMLEEPMVETSLTLTGIGALWLILMDYIMSSQIQGFPIAFHRHHEYDDCDLPVVSNRNHFDGV